MIAKVLQLQKRSSYTFDFIQDKFCYNLTNNSYAIADGTTQSFKSEIWADLLVKSFCSSPTFDISTLIIKFKEAAQNYLNVPVILSTNPAIASIERNKYAQGATSTFIGIQIVHNVLEVICCGDSNLFIIHNSKLTGYPFSDLTTLDLNSHFLNTKNLLQDEFDRNSIFVKKIPLELGDVVILASDAISRLMLRHPEVKEELMNLNGFNELKDFCVNYWDEKDLEEDDITFLMFKYIKTRG